MDRPTTHPNTHARTPLEFLIWMLLLPGVAVTGNHGLEDVTPLVLGIAGAIRGDGLLALVGLIGIRWLRAS